MRGPKKFQGKGFKTKSLVPHLFLFLSPRKTWAKPTGEPAGAALLRLVAVDAKAQTRGWCELSWVGGQDEEMDTSSALSWKSSENDRIVSRTLDTCVFVGAKQ